MKNRLPLKALNIYNEYIKTLHGNIPNKGIIAQKHNVYTMLLEENIKNNIDDEENINHYYKLLTETILDEIKKYYGRNNSMQYQLKQNLLKAHILYWDHFKKNKQRATQLFKQTCDEYNIGYWTKDDQTNEWILDVHYFGYETAKFLLEYVFCLVHL